MAARKGSEGVPIPGGPHAVARAAAGDYHTVERLLAVERRGRGLGGAGSVDAVDTWVRRRDLDGGSQRLADKMLRATGKATTKPSLLLQAAAAAGSRGASVGGQWCND